jgi:hypothetical protein
MRMKEEFSPKWRMGTRIGNILDGGEGVVKYNAHVI